MRFTTRIGGSCVAALTALGLGGAALGQQAGGTTDDAVIDEVVIVGIRGSLQRAQDIKRNAPTVMEAISLEDLGKFTDSSISDALQRVPGLNVEHRRSLTFGDTDGVSIRGLGPEYGSTTLNGRDLLGTPGFSGNGGRQFDYSTVPAEILTGVNIYKQSSSRQVEPGLSGQVDFRTLRPLDSSLNGNAAWFGSATASIAGQSDHSETSPRVSGIVGGRFAEDTLGFYVSGVYAEEKYLMNELLNYVSPFSYGVTDANGNVTQYQDSLTTWGTHFWRSDTTFERTAAATALQYRPSDNWEFIADATYMKFDGKKDDQAIYFQQTNIFSLAPGVNFGPGGAVIGGTRAGAVFYDSSTLPPDIGANTGFSYITTFQLHNPNENWNAGLNGSWTSDDGDWKISGDYSHSEFDFYTSWIQPYVRNRGGESTIDLRGDEPVFTFTNDQDDQISDPNSYLNQDLIEFSEYFQRFTRSDRNSVHLDSERHFSDAMSLLVGVRYSKTNYSFISMNFRGSTSPTSLTDYFTGQMIQLPFMPFPTPETSFDGFCGSNPQFCNQTNVGIGSAVSSFPTTTSGLGHPDDVFDLNRGGSFEVAETNTAFYVQLNHQGTLGNLPYSGNIGVRGVRIDVDAKAFQGTTRRIGFQSAPITSSVLNLASVENDYTEYLPSLNMTLMPQEHVNLRLGIGKTISLPDYLAVAPRGTANIVDPQPPSGFRENNFASVGNTFLKPTKAWNYDLTGEYYTDYGGAYIISLFYKDVSDQLTPVTQLQVPIPGQDPNVLFDFDSTFNASEGNTYGLEFGTNQPFTFLAAPWDGFGIQANYTYVDSETEVSGVKTRFPGSSEHNFNVNAYYERQSWAARIAYAYRSEYLRILSPTNSLWTNAITQVDASLSKKLGDNWDVILTGSNLTNNELIMRSEQGGHLDQRYSQPRTYSLAIRATF